GPLGTPNCTPRRAPSRTAPPTAARRRRGHEGSPAPAEQMPGVADDGTSPVQRGPGIVEAARHRTGNVVDAAGGDVHRDRATRHLETRRVARDGTSGAIEGALCLDDAVVAATEADHRSV